MQVNNNVQSPNFGMALKLQKGSKEALKKLPMETIEKLQKAGEDLKDTQFYHVEVADDLSAKITADKDAYFGLFPKLMSGHFAIKNGTTKEAGKMVPADNIIMIENDGGTIAGVARYVPYGETKPFFNAWGPVGAYNTVGDVPKLAKLAKILDTAAAEQYSKNLQKTINTNIEKEKVSKAVDEMLDNFGV